MSSGPVSSLFLSFASPKIPRVSIGARIDAASVLHKRRQQVAGLLDPRHIPQRPRPFADGLIIEFVCAMLGMIFKEVVIVMRSTGT
jgi:hypothetical protein